VARKRVWLSWLPEGDEAGEVRGLVTLLSKSGLEVDGTPWSRDLDKVGWLETAQVLVEPEKADVWLVAGRAEDFQDRAVRYGLSLTQAMVRAKRGVPLATLCAGLDAALAQDALPALLHGVDRLGPPPAAWGAKTIAAAMRARSAAVDAEPFRFSIIAHQRLGQWFEVGPVQGDWKGALFGIDDGEITHHGVGPSGMLPERCTLEHPSIGMRIEAGGRELTCASVENRLAAGESYYVRVTGAPQCVLFGEHPEQDEAEVRILELS
jgi:hypothetical protein